MLGVVSIGIAYLTHLVLTRVWFTHLMRRPTLLSITNPYSILVYPLLAIPMVFTMLKFTNTR
jgi:hypothetical protein